MQVGISEAAKAYVALAGAIATALLGVFASDTGVGQVLTVIAVIATAVSTWAVPNKPKKRTTTAYVGGGRHMKRDEAGHYNGGPYGIVGVIVLVLLLLILLAVVGVI